MHACMHALSLAYDRNRMPNPLQSVTTRFEHAIKNKTLIRCLRKVKASFVSFYFLPESPFGGVTQTQAEMNDECRKKTNEHEKVQRANGVKHDKLVINSRASRLLR